MNLCSIEGTQIKVARTAPAKHKADFALILYAIKETKSMDILRSRVPLPLPTFPDRCLMQLPIVSSHPLDEIPGPIRGCQRMTTDATGINQM